MMRHPLFRALLIAVPALALLASISIAAQSEIYVCVSPIGLVRVVAPNSQCKPGWTLLHWAITGPQGPQGPAGPAGPPGVQGPPGPTPLITFYRDRGAFTAAAGSTTTIDFSTVTANNNFFESLTIAGVTFHNVWSYWQWFIYTVPGAPVPGGEMRVDLPADTRAVGTNLGAMLYGDPGMFTIALPTGQESTAMSASGSYATDFLGVVSDMPIPWVTFRFYTSCTPPGLALVVSTCAAFINAGFMPGIGGYDNFTFGPGN